MAKFWDYFFHTFPLEHRHLFLQWSLPHSLIIMLSLYHGSKLNCRNKCPRSGPLTTITLGNMAREYMCWCLMRMNLIVLDHIKSRSNDAVRCYNSYWTLNSKKKNLKIERCVSYQIILFNLFCVHQRKFEIKMFHTFRHLHSNLHNFSRSYTLNNSCQECLTLKIVW